MPRPKSKATRVPHASGTGTTSARVPDSVRVLNLARWPGITEPRCETGSCTWAWHDGKYQLKYINRICPTHGRLAAS